MEFIPVRTMVVLDSYPIVESGLYEIHAEVGWDNLFTGTRFFHVRHDPVPSCISEAIEADILKDLSAMRQKMTGHATLEPGTITLEVWSTEACLAEKIKFEVIKIQ